MNQQAARESRKELRRAIGTEASTLLNGLADVAINHERRFEALDAARSTEAAVFTDLQRRVARLEADAAYQQSRFWHKLRARFNR